MITVDQYLDRMGALARHAGQLSSRQARVDMGRMLGAAQATAQNLSRELVECRRLNRITERAKSIETELVEQLDHAEKMLVYAQMRYR